MTLSRRNPLEPLLLLLLLPLTWEGVERKEEGKLGSEVEEKKSEQGKVIRGSGEQGKVKE